MNLEVPVEVPDNEWVIKPCDETGELMVKGQGILDVYYLKDVMDNHIRMMEAKIIKNEKSA